MILDAQNLFSDAQVVTTGSENGVISTNVIDLKTAGIDIGAGEPIWVHVNIDTAMTSSGSNDTLTVDLVTDDNASMTSPTKIQEIGVFPAVSAAGTVMINRIKPSSSFQQYIALRYTAAADPLTAGAFTAALCKDVQRVTNYAKNYSIS